MKTKLYSLAILFVLATLSSCEKTVTFDDARKTDNEKQFERISSNPEYKKIMSESGNGYIMYKEIADGKSGVRPAFTDKVKVLYTGWFKRFWEKQDTFTGDDGNIFKNKVIFDSTSDRNNNPSTFLVKSLVDGFSTALQNMEVGDKWEIWIPSKLGYGSAGRKSADIQPHTTLVFEVELLEIVKK